MRPERSWWKTWLVPVLLIGAGLGTTVYFVQHPGGPMAARVLTYEHVGTLAVQHVSMVVVSSLAAVATAVPLGILVSRRRLRVVGTVVENVVNVAQTVPSIAVIALFFTVLGLGFNTAVFALWLYSLLPILRNTYAGIISVPPGVLEAATGMGMPPVRILTRIELPLAFPIIMAGVRTAVVVNVGTATLATFIGAGGFGHLIVTGITVQRLPLLLCGCILSALLAVLCDHLLGLVEERVRGAS
ncbi:MAG: Binding-protein-dependent transport systems inner membrane component [Clostridia bacterium 62_21]|nr:MAG: Binding-protein-dependent transport systems inner membrane component [Clostridia bacterium 62_21]HAG07928.1 ABC transporter permease [Peptococcaceae bacterium]